MFGATELTAVLGAPPRPGADTAAWVKYARALADAGLPALLVQPGTKYPADLRSEREKDGPGGVHLATTDRATLKKYVERALKDPAEHRPAGHPTPYGPGAHLNWAVRLGGSGYVVADADTPGEVAALRSFLAEHYGGESKVPGPTVLTPGTADGAHKGGGHWWFKLPEGREYAGASATVTVTVPDHSEGFSIYAGDAYVLIPPSRRPEGDYLLVGSDNTAPDPLLAELETAEATAAELVERREDRKRKAEAGELGDMEDQVAAWSQVTPWSEVLTGGWMETGLADNCGCPIWTAPGAHSSPKSATTHVDGCSRPTVDPLNPPMHLWTDNPGPELEAVVAESGSKTMSKLTAYAALAHGGDMSAALEAAEVSAGGGQTLDPARLAELLDPAVSELEREAATEALESLRPDVAKHVQDLMARREAERVVKRLERSQAEGDRKPVEAVSLADLMAQDPPAERWTIDGLWSAEGQTLLYAPAKVGKSRLAHNVLEALTGGGLFLDKFRALQATRRVGLIDMELAPAMLQSRLKDLDRTEWSNGVVWTLRDNPSSFDLTDPATLAEWAAKIKAQDVEVLIVDPLSAVIRSTGLDEWRDGGRVLQLLRELCARAGVRAHLVVDHASSKAGGMDNGPRGDSGKLDVVDHVWKFYPDGDNEATPTSTDRFHLETTGRAYPVSATVRLDGGRYVSTEPLQTSHRGLELAYRAWPAVQGQVDKAHRQMMTEKPDRDPAMAWPSRNYLQETVRSQITAQCGVGRNQLREALDSLTAQGVLETVTGNGKTGVLRPSGREPINPADPFDNDPAAGA
ncbi:gp54 protein [Corynebacterium maris DSM 45190]|uniref:Gp54 protein n=1 Tax=Corynebacterium maris DSM 45190 TaxID=1224163 RepID=S5SSE6_9CORY|nr:AAA family ATPase [Corynebacterium maris]AGS34034.1 gp54 protein [Corynebacterium maris DSM 45190]